MCKHKLRNVLYALFQDVINPIDLDDVQCYDNGSKHSPRRYVTLIDWGALDEDQKIVMVMSANPFDPKTGYYSCSSHYIRKEANMVSR